MQDLRIRHLKYDRARLSLIKLIAESGIKVGDCLPPERELVKHLPCSMITLRRALADMVESGLIVRRQGSGTYLAHAIQHDRLTNYVLYVNVYRPGYLNGTVLLEKLQVYLAHRGVGLRTLSVSDFGAEIVNEAGAGCIGVLTAGWLTDAFIMQLKVLNLPLVVLGNNSLTVDVPSVSIDVEGAVYRMCRIMLDDRLQKIVFVHGGSSYYLASQQEHGYRRAMSEAGFEPLVMSSADDHSYYAALDSFMGEHGDMEGLLLELTAFADFSAWLWEHGCGSRPALGILGTLVPSHHYHQSRRLMWMEFDSMSLRGGEMLLNHVLMDSPLVSIQLPPLGLAETREDE